MGINKVILVGNVGRDPEFKSLPSGTNLATFSLATTDKRFKDENGEPQTEWHNIVVWGRQAEIANQYITKGKQLYLEGRIRTRSYEKDGQKKYFTEIHCDRFEMLGGRGGGGGGGEGGGYSQGGPGPSSGGGGPSFPDDADDVPF